TESGKATSVTMPELLEFTRRKDYVPRAAHLVSGGDAEDVLRAERYLSTFGYMKSEALREFGMRPDAMAALPEPTGAFGEPLQNALRQFQSFNRLPVTGELDQPTLD